MPFLWHHATPDDQYEGKWLKLIIILSKQRTLLYPPSYSNHLKVSDLVVNIYIYIYLYICIFPLDTTMFSTLVNTDLKCFVFASVVWVSAPINICTVVFILISFWCFPWPGFTMGWEWSIYSLTCHLWSFAPSKHIVTAQRCHLCTVKTSPGVFVRKAVLCLSCQVTPKHPEATAMWGTPQRSLHQIFQDCALELTQGYNPKPNIRNLFLCQEGTEPRGDRSEEMSLRSWDINLQRPV